MIRSRTLLQIARKAGNGWLDDRASTMGAALSYYTALSLAPLLLIVVSVAGLMFGREAAAGVLLKQIDGIVGTQAGKAIQSVLASADQVNDSVLSIIIGSVVLLVGATSVFAELQGDLDQIWKVKPAANRSTIWIFFRTRLLSFGLLVSVGFLLLVSTLISALITALTTYWGHWLSGREELAMALHGGVSLLIITLLFALLYKLLPSTPVKWGDVWLGATTASLLFAVGKFGIGLYLGTAALSSTFGAAGAVVALMVWIYYAAQIFLFGAEITVHYAETVGSMASES